MSLRAANWVRVGESAGRGRNDRVNAAPETRKAVYVYELEQDWRERLGLPVPGFEPLAAGEGLDAGVWAANEFGGAPLGDARLSARLVQGAHHMAHSPMRAITGAAHGERALIKGHYRLIDQPADSEVTVDNILAPHRRRTVQRMQSEDTVLCVQDTTYLNFTRRSQTPGLTTIGTNQTGALARGLQLHATLALDPDGTPLGVLRADFSVPPDTPGPKAREQKKSFRWIEGLHDCAEVASHLPHTRPVCVMDREADFLDLFVQQREHAPAVDLLVRAKHNRVLAEEADTEGDRVVEHLFDKLRGPPSRGRCTVDVSRQSARAKASKQRRKPKRLARQAELTLRYERVTLPRPGDKPIALWMVHAREQRPPLPLPSVPATTPGSRYRGVGLSSLGQRSDAVQHSEARPARSSGTVSERPTTTLPTTPSPEHAPLLQAYFVATCQPDVGLVRGRLLDGGRLPPFLR